MKLVNIYYYQRYMQVKHKEWSSFRNMRLLVLFDLPTATKADRKTYSQFRKFLLDDGFTMMQYSVYTRFCRNDIDANKHIKRVKSLSPKQGNIRILKITEKQFENMEVTIGSKTTNEIVVNSEQTLIIE